MRCQKDFLMTRSAMCHEEDYKIALRESEQEDEKRESVGV